MTAATARAFGSYRRGVAAPRGWVAWALAREALPPATSQLLRVIDALGAPEDPTLAADFATQLVVEDTPITRPRFEARPWMIAVVVAMLAVIIALIAAQS